MEGVETFVNSEIIGSSSSQLRRKLLEIYEAISKVGECLGCGLLMVIAISVLYWRCFGFASVIAGLAYSLGHSMTIAIVIGGIAQILWIHIKFSLLQE